MKEKSSYRKAVDKLQWVYRNTTYGSPFKRHLYCISWGLMSARDELGTSDVRGEIDIIAEGMVKHKIIWC